MKKIVEDFITKYNIKEPVLIGYSTGKDSTALLHLLYQIGIKIIAIHLNHGWRKNSVKEEKFAREFCASLGIEFYCEKLDNSIAKTETKAREARYEFFERAAEHFNANAVFLAHNKNDNVETLVYRIVKGTGILGLKSIPKNRGIIYRPLLDVTRDEIEKYVEQNSLEFCEDESNSDTRYSRNWVRHKIIPSFEKINPNYINSISNLIEVANFECEILDEALELAQKEVFEGSKMNTQKFLQQTYPIKLKLIYNYLKDDLKFYDLARIKRIVDFIIFHTNEVQDPQYRKYKRFSINSKLFLYTNKKEIFKK